MYRDFSAMMAGLLFVFPETLLQSGGDECQK